MSDSVDSADPFGYTGPAEIVAHRGFSARAPENTLASIRAALDAGADAVEFDLQTTRDGRPVLLHDDTLDRTTDRTGPVSEVSLDELAGADAGRWFDERFAGEPVPTLEAALELLADPPVRIYPEVKRTGRAADLHRIAGVVRSAGLSERTVFISMDWAALDEIRAAMPEARIGYIVHRPHRAEAALRRARGDRNALLDYDARILRALPVFARRARSAGVPLATWTVNATSEADTLLEMGVPRITTDRVDTLLEWKAGLAGD